jgi:hypothetical protein
MDAKPTYQELVPLPTVRAYNDLHRSNGATLKPTIVAFWFLWMLPFITPTRAADFGAGKKAYDRGDYATAAREWKAASDRGDAEAQFWLGTLYEYGRGVEKDELTGRQLQLLSAERGYEYAQNALGWPIKDENRPYLTCSPYPERKPRPTSIEVTPEADSMKGFQFEITFHNARPPIERPIMSAVNMSEKPKAPNIEIAVYQIVNGARREVPHAITSWGGSGGGGAGISNVSLLAGVRIPIEELERRSYIEQFLSLLSSRPGQTPEKVQQTRQLLLHSDRPSERSYIDDVMPNRLGTYEIVCRFQSQDPGFWPLALEAPPLRFEYVKTMDWIEIFKGKRPTPK